MFLSQWHLDPVYITGNWTDELLDLMVAKLSERLTARTRKPEGSVEALELASGGKIRVVKHGD